MNVTLREAIRDSNFWFFNVAEAIRMMIVVSIIMHIMPYLELMYDKEGVMQIARAKQAVDPNLILNVGNMVPREYLEEL